MGKLIRTETGRGLFASAEIEEGKVILRIPGKCLVNLDTLGDFHEQYPGYGP